MSWRSGSRHPCHCNHVLAQRLDFKLFRTLTVWTVFAWPVVAVLMMTATATAGSRCSWSGLLRALAGARDRCRGFPLALQPGFGELFLLWAIIMGPPTVVIVLLANRAWRSVGLTALFVSSFW